MNKKDPIRVLVVEDSPSARELLLHLLDGAPDIQVAGTATNGRQALREVERLRPDLVTMDIVMPEMDGLETTRRLMETHPLPIIIVSGTVNRREISTTFEALKAGALAAIPRPAGPGSPEHAPAARELLRTIRAMAEVRVVHRWPAGGKPLPPPPPVTDGLAAPRVVAIGASTGGPEALRCLLGALPADFPLPLLMVQHMAAGFLGGLADWLGRSSPLPVALARDGEPVREGHVYLAPDDRHLGMAADRRLVLSSGPPEKGVRPSVSHLFRSVRASCGGRAVAVLLTGMGDDGVAEMKALREAGALTIAQDRATAVIFGMPGEAVRTGAAMHQLSPGQIALLLAKIAAPAGRQGRN